MNNKRTILFTFFTMSFLLLFDSWQRFNGESSFFTPNIQVNNNAKTTQANTTVANNSNTINSPINNLSTTNLKAQKINLTTDVYQVELDTLGASITGLKLLQYSDKDNKTPIELFGTKHNYNARSGIINGPNHTNIFTPTTLSTQTVLGNNQSLIYALSSTINNIELIKTYTFYKSSYIIDVDFTIKNHSNTAINPTIYVELLRDGATLQDSMFYSTFTGPALYTNENKFHKISFDELAKLAKNKEEYKLNSDNGWIAMIQHYFVSSWIMPKADREFYAQNINNLYRIGFKSNLASLAPSASITQKAKIFAGPQQEKLLEQTASGLDLVKDYGWVTMLAKPLFWLLEKIHTYIDNWGWSIILLTLLLKTIFYPLTASSQRSMARMKDLQPKISALKEQFGNEPQKMQKEMLAIYRKEKINPMGGCLPMLIQIPVFIALYFVLLSSIEMRHAPWILWIKDLSIPDPYYILPVLMAASMFLQIKLNPKPADPMQAKMMMVIPMVFSFMFFFFPAGLVLYYVVNNLISISQQWYIMRKLAN